MKRDETRALIRLFALQLLCSRPQSTCAFVNPSVSFHVVTFHKKDRFSTPERLRAGVSSDDDDGERRGRPRLGGGAVDRRLVFGDFVDVTAATAAVVATSCGCCVGCCPGRADALVPLVPADRRASALYDAPRNQIADALFAKGMSTGMVSYEREAFPKKKELFATLFDALRTNDDDDDDEERRRRRRQPVVVELGMGSFPNAVFYKGRKGLDVVGVDPNDRMEDYARNNAKRAGVTEADDLRIVHGVSEALPLPDASVDAVVCTLTLCSVLDPERSVAEIRRVLRPGGKFLFWEHVLSETDESLRRRQIALTPMQMRNADGCHLDRRTGETIRAAGFKKLDMEYLELKNFSVLNPTVCGIATA